MNGPRKIDPNNYDDVVYVANLIGGKLKLPRKPSVGIVCGSGLSDLAEGIKDPLSIPYKDIPGIPEPTVSGHKGQLVFGELEGTQVVCMQGRIHPYEGHPLSTCAFPVRVMKELGIKILILTNAVGGLNRKFQAGDLMAIKDHIFFPGFSGQSPLYGFNDERLGPRFPSTNNGYDKGLRNLAHEVALEQGVTLREGIYVMVGGPQFETPAENRLLLSLGADAVGMSVCHEAIVARHSGLKLLAISLITNVSEMNSEAEENRGLHNEVLDEGKRNAEKAQSLVKGILAKLDL